MGLKNAQSWLRPLKPEKKEANASAGSLSPPPSMWSVFTHPTWARLLQTGTDAQDLGPTVPVPYGTKLDPSSPSKGIEEPGSHPASSLPSKGRRKRPAMAYCSRGEGRSALPPKGKQKGDHLLEA